MSQYILVESLGVGPVWTMASTIGIIKLHFFPMCILFVSFSCLSVLGQTESTVLSYSPNFGGHALSSSLFSMMLTRVFSYVIFIMLSCSSIPSCIKSYIKVC